ncbi:hypothetical protein EI94DRAFT_1097432 [Lactarius quietus]|nr:hypothetical protein EI94DRAFT_1097432 [Lactarius quietus]
MARGNYYVAKTPPWPLLLRLCPPYMAAALEFLLNFLRNLLWKLRGFIPRCFNFKSWALILAFLARKFGLWNPWNNGKGRFRRSEQAEHSLPGTGALAGVRLDEGQDQAIACSTIPPSARPLVVAAPSFQASHAGPANLTARPQHDHPQAYPPLAFDAGMHSNHSCASIQSRASDRLSIIQSQSYESLHSSLGKPKGNPKASHRQFGSGPSTDRLEGSSNVHASSGITGIYSCRWAESSASVVVEVENPSTESFPRSELVDSPTPEESYSIGSPTLHSSPASKPLNLPEESPQFTPTPSLILDLILPEHRILQMINSEQVPRYTKGVTTPREEEL